MKRLLSVISALLATALPVALLAAIPQHWTVETSRLQPAQFEAYHGETIEFAATMQTYGKPLAITNDLIGIYWQTNGMGSAYWTYPAVLSNNVMIARWTPEMDVGANVYSCFIGAPGEIYRAAFQLRLRPSPGAVPSELPLPVKTLDFAQVQVLNAPYYSKSETDAKIIELAPAPGNYATVSNRAMTAVQPAAISDMETQTHAAATFATKTALATLSDTVDTMSDSIDSLSDAVDSKLDKSGGEMTVPIHGGYKIKFIGGTDGLNDGIAILNSNGNPAINIGVVAGTLCVTSPQFYGGNFEGTKYSIQGGYTTFEASKITHAGRNFEFPEVSGTLALLSNIPSIAATDTTFSNAVLAVGLNIDTNSVAQINAILDDLGGVPIEGTATTVGGLLLALAAAVAWLKKNALRKGIDSGGIPVDPNVSALFAIANTQLKQTIIDVAGEKVNIGVTAVTQDGVTVTGQTVYVHNGTSADDPVVASIAYNGQPVTLTVDKGIQYFVRISDTLAMHFNPTAASGYATGDTNVTLTYADVSTVTDLNDIAPALAAINNLATARNLLVGKEFPDVWVDYDGSGSGDATPAQVDSRPAWNDPLVITDVQMVEDADGNTHLGAVLTRKYATRYDIVFDAPNTEEATEETAQEGLYYYGLVKGATAPAAGNVTYLDLTAGDTIPYAEYEKVYKNTLRESFNATTKIVADNNVFRYGHNRYETSAYRQYLNSSAAKGEWWTQQHIGQTKPSSASSYCGYKRGCSAKLLSLIKPVKRRCVPNYVTDGGSSSDQDVGLYTVCDDFFLPCCGEMFGTANNNEVFFNDEYNYQYTYWRDLVDNPAQAPSDSVAAIDDVRKVKRINAKNGTAFVTARLRSAYRGNSYYVWVVYTGGNLYYYYNAGTANASVPACVIY